VEEETENAHLWQIVNRFTIRDRGLLQGNILERTEETLQDKVQPCLNSKGRFSIRFQQQETCKQLQVN
jgi:hypothetical protein